MHISRKRLCVALASLGLAGVASLATLPVERFVPGPLPVPVGVLRFLSLVNPTVLVVGAALAGTMLAHRIGLDAPAVRLALAGFSPAPVLREQAGKALWVGLAVGALLAGYAIVTGPYLASLDADAISRLQALTPPLPVRILYGGIAEEIIARWGTMTIVSWLVWRLAGGPAEPANRVYWIGIVAAALVFGLAHLPFLYAIAGDPPRWLPAMAMTTNVLAGAAFGWLYWRAGLEAAILAHALAHVTAALIGALAQA